MKGTVVLLKQYAGRGMLFCILIIVLLLLSGADTALALSCGKWNIIASPNVGSSQNYLHAVAVITPNDIWAVGTSQNATLTEHWNGSAWKVAYNPAPTGSLNGVAAAAANNVWAVGGFYYEQYTIPDHAVTYHWDGKRWSNVVDPIISDSSHLSALSLQTVEAKAQVPALYGTVDT